MERQDPRARGQEKEDGGRREPTGAFDERLRQPVPPAAAGRVEEERLGDRHPVGCADRDSVLSAEMNNPCKS